MWTDLLNAMRVILVGSSDCLIYNFTAFPLFQVFTATFHCSPTHTCLTMHIPFVFTISSLLRMRMKQVIHYHFVIHILRYKLIISIIKRKEPEMPVGNTGKQRGTRFYNACWVLKLVSANARQFHHSSPTVFLCIHTWVRIYSQLPSKLKRFWSKVM